MMNDTFDHGNEVKIITAQELKKLFDQNSDFILVDVRTKEEREAAHINQDVFIPLDEFAHHHESLPPEKHIIIYCRSGVRSHQAARFLTSLNYENVSNLAGGIIQWAKEIDPKLKPI